MTPSKDIESIVWQQRTSLSHANASQAALFEFFAQDPCELYAFEDSANRFTYRGCHKSSFYLKLFAAHMRQFTSNRPMKRINPTLQTGMVSSNVTMPNSEVVRIKYWCGISTVTILVSSWHLKPSVRLSMKMRFEMVNFLWQTVKITFIIGWLIILVGLGVISCRVAGFIASERECDDQPFNKYDLSYGYNPRNHTWKFPHWMVGTCSCE